VSAPTLDFYFDFISPYGWIGAEQVGALARRLDREVRWHPILLKMTVIEAMGLPPPLQTPLKGAYMRHDIGRSLRFHGLTLAPNARFSFSPLNAARVVLWAKTWAPDRMEALVLSLYRAHWSDAQDISATDTVLDIVASTGLPRAAAADALHSDGLRDAPRIVTVEAMAAGIFGSPTLVIDGEAFWGSDRFAMAEAWLETGGW
jgi:2-hydroxychromene-2-carboxylate isomerase